MEELFSHFTLSFIFYLFEVSTLYDKFWLLIDRANSSVMRLEFTYSILAMSFIIGIARPRYLVDSDMSLRSTSLTKRPPDITVMNLFAIVSSIGWKYSWISEIFRRKYVNLLLKPPIKAAYAA